MAALQKLAAGFPEAAKDLRLNLQSVLHHSSLTSAQRYGTALAVALADRCQPLAAAVIADAGADLPAAVIADAEAAAALMAMNNIYYRFRYMVGEPAYEQLPPRLRMQRLMAPAGAKPDFELFALAVSAINGCASCVQAHERAVTAAGLTRGQVNDAVRIAAVFHAAAVTSSWSGDQVDARAGRDGPAPLPA